MRKDIEIKKAKNQFKKDSRIKECFHFDNENCSTEIILAHSIQRSGVLELLEDDVDGNKSLYSFLHLKNDEEGLPVGFEPLGKKSASTFFGFCSVHDNKVFSPIENNSVNLDDDEHCFLLSYRAFAKDYHAKYESLQGYNTNEFYQNHARPEATEGLISGSELGLRDCNLVKDRLNEMLKNKVYDELNYFTYKLNFTLPLALSSSITPEYTYKNEKFNLSIDPNVFYEYVNFVIQPTEKETLILFSCLPEHKKAIKFIDQLYELKELPLERAISSLAVGHVENTFFSPSIWNKLSHSEKNTLLTELIMTIPTIRSLDNKFFNSKLNLLDKRFKKNVT